MHEAIQIIRIVIMLVAPAGGDVTGNSAMTGQFFEHGKMPMCEVLARRASRQQTHRRYWCLAVETDATWV